ncbi:hypothetical protein [Acidianus sp. HS-5]|uniref:hypothetical protein n=1 Tax=Acidianus sp. HS-5 TaxID=2886040 RepID=UPI001F218EA0|nr:hypothetical protein [Acidianus sp. HS-5]BDC17759.1 hypothetical protein HS5_06490 [Acidianus sp. HS-5]
MKGLSNVVMMVIILVIVLSIFIPLGIELMYFPQNDQTILYSKESYSYYHCLICQDISSGFLKISYSLQQKEGGYKVILTFCLAKDVGGVPICKLNISEILYYNGKWCVVKSSYPLIVPISYAPHTITFCLTSPSDLVIVTNYGNLIFIAPGSST